jgi:hypothetical protein
MLLLVLPATLQAQFELATNSDTITITRYSGFGGAVAIPSTTNGLPVTCIGDYAFAGSTTVTSVTIPGSVTNIGVRAFAACSSLTAIDVASANAYYGSVNGVLFDAKQTTLIQCPGGTVGTYTIPGSVTNIGDAAFAGCFVLTTIAVDAANTSFRGVGGILFNTDQTTLLQCPGGRTGSYAITNTVTNIGNSAFGSCIYLTNISIPASITRIGDEAFNWCTSLSTITIPGSVANLGAAAFAGCAALTSLTLSNGITSIGDVAFENCSSLTGVTIPGSVTNIGQAAFDGCSGLTSVTISNGVISIGINAFRGGANLTSVAIPGSVTSIGSQAFVDCSRLVAIVVDPANAVYSSMDGVLFNKGQATLIEYPGGKAGSYVIPTGVTNVEASAFAVCAGLNSVTIPSSVISLGFQAFIHCTSLTNVTILGGVTSIGDGAFGDCPGLVNLTIPRSVASIGDYACYGCTGLTSVFFEGDAPAASWKVFYDVINATVYYLPGSAGWGPTYGGRPALLWNPVIQTDAPSFGVQTNHFGFNIIGTPNIPIVVEACSSLANPSWTPLRSFPLTNGSSYFSDPEWSNYPRRFYRLRSP